MYEFFMEGLHEKNNTKVEKPNQQASNNIQMHFHIYSTNSIKMYDSCIVQFLDC